MFCCDILPVLQNTIRCQCQFQLLAMGGGTWETRLECQWAATAGRTTWSHHPHMVLDTHTHIHSYSCPSRQSAVDQLKTQGTTASTAQHVHLFKASVSTRTSTRLALVRDLLTHFLSRQEMHSFGVSFKVCVLRCDVKSLCVCAGETTDEVSFNNCLWNAARFPPYGLGPTSLFVQGAIRVALTHILNQWAKCLAQVD